MDFVIATTAAAAATTVIMACYCRRRRCCGCYLLLSFRMHTNKFQQQHYMFLSAGTFSSLSANVIFEYANCVCGNESHAMLAIQAFDVFIVCVWMWHFRHRLLILHFLWSHCDRFNQKRICHIEWQQHTINLQDYHLYAVIICMYQHACFVFASEWVCLWYFLSFSLLNAMPWESIWSGYDSVPCGLQNHFIVNWVWFAV